MWKPYSERLSHNIYKLELGFNPGLSEARNQAANPCSRKVMVLMKGSVLLFLAAVAFSFLRNTSSASLRCWSLGKRHAESLWKICFFAKRSMPAESSGHMWGSLCFVFATPCPVCLSCLSLYWICLAPTYCRLGPKHCVTGMRVPCPVVNCIFRFFCHSTSTFYCPRNKVSLI